MLYFSVNLPPSVRPTLSRHIHINMGSLTCAQMLCPVSRRSMQSNILTYSRLIKGGTFHSPWAPTGGEGRVEGGGEAISASAVCYRWCERRGEDLYRDLDMGKRNALLYKWTAVIIIMHSGKGRRPLGSSQREAGGFF